MNNIKYKPVYDNSWALIIGINNYKSAPPLSYAVNDAESIEGILIGELNFPKENVTLLKNEDATKKSILDSYLSFREVACNPDDRILVFFAGHGTTISGIREPIGCLVPFDGDQNKLNTLIRWDEFTRNADLIYAKHILFIMDSCYSGLAIKRTLIPGPQRFLLDILRRLSRQVITAGKADETVVDGGGEGGRNSIFTDYLIKGLKGEAKDENGIITANGLMNYVYQKVGEDNRSNQTPHYGHIDGDGDFVLLTPNNEHLSSKLSKDYLISNIEEKPESISTSVVKIPNLSFSESIRYSDPKDPNFGRNELSEKLGEFRYNEDRTKEIVKAFSWLSLIVEPSIGTSLIYDIEKLSGWLQEYNDTVNEKPFNRFRLPTRKKTTIDSLILYDNYYDWNIKLWSHYLRINFDGNIEYVDSRNAFWVHKGNRIFHFIQIIGVSWQFLFLAKKILKNIKYKSDVHFIVNLVGTKDTALKEFSEGAGKDNKVWNGSQLNINDLIFQGDQEDTCSDKNLKIEFHFVLSKLNEKESKKIIVNLAKRLSLAYNHRSIPNYHCFNYGTTDFHWNQFFHERV